MDPGYIDPLYLFNMKYFQKAWERKLFKMAEKSDSENCLGVSGKCSNVKEGKHNEMFLRIINADGVNIKSQQRTETDLSTEEKTGVLKDIYERNPRLFLERFGEWLSEEDLTCFSEISGSYDVDYTIKKLKENLARKSSGTSVKNRRYEALQRLEKDSSYFSEYEMRQRCPLLYEQYIGQYMTDEEKLARDEKQMSGEVTMSSFIFQQIDRDWLEKQQEMERQREEECMEEEDDEEEEESENVEEDTSSEITKLNDEEKLNLREEFLNVMRQHFLEGEDKDFDYSKVDTSEEYDNLQILGQDEEDKYFDEEEPEVSKDGNQETTSTDSDDDDYLSDKILLQCCKAAR